MCVHDAIFAQNNYCAKPNPETDAHYGSWFHNGLGYQAPHITLDYYIATAIVIWTLTQTATCEMGLVIFAAMALLKVDSTTSASLNIIPFTEITNR